MLYGHGSGVIKRPERLIRVDTRSLNLIDHVWGPLFEEIRLPGMVSKWEYRGDLREGVDAELADIGEGVELMRNLIVLAWCRVH